MQRAILAADLLQCLGAGAAELHAAGLAFVIEPGARPKVSAVARLQAARGSAHVTNLRHEATAVDDDDRGLLGLLDGTRASEEIAAQWFGGRPGGDAAAAPDASLGRFARQALLVQ